MPRSVELGKLVERFTCTQQNSPTWPSFLRQIRGRSCLHPRIGELPHDAAPYLAKLRSIGAPVEVTTPTWTTQQKLEAITRGPHQSSRAYLGFLESEMVDMITQKFWIVLPYDIVQHYENLRISPIGVVPQRERRPRTIVDYSYSGLNKETQKMAPPEAMQFGRALHRLLYRIFTAPKNQGPIYMLKIDLSDGFYRLRVKPEDVLKLGVAFPTAPGEPKLVAFPITLPMGWTESPPYFCSATETVVDIANQYAGLSWDPPPHRLEPAAATQPPPEINTHSITVPLHLQHTPLTTTTFLPNLPLKPHRLRHRAQPLAYADVFVDDEVLLGQGSKARLNRFRRQVMHINDAVFRPNDTRDHHRKEPISAKKLLRGDACWSTRKQLLGWLVDTLRGTLELPPHRKERLLTILTDVIGKNRLSVNKTHKLLGELRSMVLGIPGGQGLFSQLQVALTRRSDKHRVRLHQGAQDAQRDFLHLAKDLANRPTRIAELFPTVPAHHTGACNAARNGMGGVWLPQPHSLEPPLVWRHPFPEHIQSALVSFDNPAGTITNSDLELAGTVAQAAVLAANKDLRETTLAICTDNTPALAWQGRGAKTTTGPASYLLRLAALQQRQFRYVVQHSYIPGPANHLANIASPRFDLSDTALLSHLNSVAPHSQP